MRFKRRNLAPTVDVLAWLQANHPEIHAIAELDRVWTWIPDALEGPQYDQVREALKAFGFSLARRGHPLKSGRMGWWAHPGTQPIPFTSRARRFRGQGGGGGNNLEAEVDAILQGVAA